MPTGPSDIPFHLSSYFTSNSSILCVFSTRNSLVIFDLVYHRFVFPVT